MTCWETISACWRSLANSALPSRATRIPGCAGSHWTWLPGNAPALQPRNERPGAGHGPYGRGSRAPARGRGAQHHSRCAEARRALHRAGGAARADVPAAHGGHPGLPAAWRRARSAGPGGVDRRGYGHHGGAGTQVRACARSVARSFQSARAGDPRRRAAARGGCRGRARRPHASCRGRPGSGGRASRGGQRADGGRVAAHGGIAAGGEARGRNRLFRHAGGQGTGASGGHRNRPAHGIRAHRRLAGRARYRENPPAERDRAHRQGRRRFCAGVMRAAHRLLRRDPRRLAGGRPLRNHARDRHPAGRVPGGADRVSRARRLAHRP
ncbi:hypothetical protein D3C83_00880 [compost metagenome]